MKFAILIIIFNFIYYLQVDKIKNKIHNREKIEGAPVKITGRHLYNKLKF